MSFQPKVFRVLLAAALSLALGLSACGGGGSDSGTLPPGGSSSNGTDCTQPTSSDVDGCAYVALSDETGDYLTYTVKVADIVLTRRDGTTVSLVPSKTTVDFAQYTSLSEFLSLNAVPAGDYVSGVITLDYSGATIEAQDSSGNAVKLKPVDSSGKALGTVDLTITLDSDHPLGLFPGEAHVLGIDFDLDASNTINSNGTVTVDPFLTASVDTASSQTAVRGPLSSTSAGNDTFMLGLHPFQSSSGDYGKVIVYGSSSTTYVVNQKIFTGAAGVTALQAAGTDTAVLAKGSFNFNNHHFTATQVLAGSSVAGGTKDAVEGVVTARNGNTLTVRGASLYRQDSSVSFHDTATVDLASSTLVRRSDKPRTTLGINAISVGQRVLVFGDFGSSSSTTLNASSGFALMEFTDIDGSVNSLVDNGMHSSINLNLTSIAGRPISLFDFTGTSTDTTVYQVSLPCSCLNTGVNINDPVTVSGFPSSFGTAPPDASATALTDFGLADSVLSATWSGNGTSNAFTAIDPNSGIVVDLSSSPTVHQLREGGQVTDLGSLPAVPAVASRSLGVYAILKGGNVQVYLKFSNFVSALQSDLSGGAKVKGFFAVGGYDSPDDLLNTTSVAVVLR
ncbi:MAG TPA: hypothetical protein VGM16_00225 [Gammaproteobacteria bacterium]|jgi:hypothetical protein